LQTDPRDVGCDQVLRILHVYCELVLDDESGTEAARRYPMSQRTPRPASIHSARCCDGRRDGE
jgi:hypothetical protein